MSDFEDIVPRNDQPAITPPPSDGSAAKRAARRACDVLEGLASGFPQESGQILVAVKTLRLRFGLLGPGG